MGVFTTIALAVTLASTVYQVRQAKKQAEAARRAAEEAAEARKGQEIAVEAESSPLPVIYGRSLIAGTRVYHNTRSSFTAALPVSTTGIVTSVTNLSSTTNSPIYDSLLGVVISQITVTDANKYRVVLSSVQDQSKVIVDNLFRVGNSKLFKIITVESKVGSNATLIVEDLTYEKPPSLSGFGGFAAKLIFSLNRLQFLDVNSWAGKVATISTKNSNFSSKMSNNISGDKNEFLFVQQALCQGELSQIVDVLIDDQDLNSDPIKYGYFINTYPSGNQADPMMTANFSERASSKFTDTPYASMCFRLNRDDPQYGGVPNVQFFVFGNKVRTLYYDDIAGEVKLTTDKVYSDNPALCLLDYLLSDKYGRGLTADKIDLLSFYKAARICEYVVQRDIAVNGRVWKNTGVTKRDLPLYECNLVIDTSKPVRENIIDILATMGDADLVWSAGKYKLQLQYPQGINDTIISAELSDDDLVRESISISYPSASERLNYCTIKFYDESLDFKENSASWPQKGSTVYSTYLSQDNLVPLETSYTEAGIIDAYHALAKAEELVRVSRSSVVYTFKLSLKNTFFEPGDIIKVNTTSNIINNELLKIREIKVDEKAEVEITAVKYDPAQLAWNAKDDELVPVRNSYNFTILPVDFSTIRFIPTTSLDTNSLGTISWDVPLGITPSSYTVSYKKFGDTEFTFLGITNSNSLSLFSLKAGEYLFKIVAKSTLGYSSTPTISSLIRISDGTEHLTDFTLSDTIVLNSGKVITNLLVKILSPQIDNLIVDYEVDARKQGDLEWVSLGSSGNSTFEYTNVVDKATYEVRARVVNKLGNKGAYTIKTRNIIGKTAPPSDVSGFNYNIDNNAINFKWNAVNDLDIDLYEIREGISWEDSTLVARVTDNFFSIQNPKALTKTYFIKSVDTTGNYSLNSSFVEVTVSAPGEIVLSGNFTGENYILNWTKPNSLLSVEEYIIQKESVEIARIKSNTFSGKADWVGSKEFSVTAVDISGNLGVSSITTLVVSQPPATVMSNEVIDNNVLLSWQRVTSTLPIVGYELRKGTTWETATLIGVIQSEFSVIFESKAGLYTYWIAAKDSANNLGIPASLSTSVAQPPDFILALDYYSDFSSTTTQNVVNNAGAGIVLPVDPTRTWESQFITQGWTSLQDAIDASPTIFIQPGESFGYYEEVIDYGTTLGNIKITVIPTFDQLCGLLTYQTDISVSLDGVTYIDYLNNSEVFASNFRYLKVKFSVSSPTNCGILNITRLNIVLSAKLKNDGGNVYCNNTDVNGTIVNFNEDFTDIESIIVTPKGTTPAIAVYDFIDQPNPTSFSVYLFNPTTGNRVSGTVSWSAKGY